MGNIFDALTPFIPATPATGTVDELDHFLASPCESTGGDVLGWWYARRAIYPRLSRMAMDYIVVPGAYLVQFFMFKPNTTCLATTVDVERVFSRGRILLSHTRNRLSAKSIRALMCVGEWSRMGLVRPSDIRNISTDANGIPDIEEIESEEALEKLWKIVARNLS